MIEQSAKAVVMIRPFRFYPNPETASDNAFQREVAATDADTISKAAQEEFDQAVESLRDAGVTVHVFDDTASPEKPDAVFPNNWFSTHHDGRVALYPMYSPTRRNERRRDVIDELGKHYRISALVDYSVLRADAASISKARAVSSSIMSIALPTSRFPSDRTANWSKGFARISASTRCCSKAWAMMAVRFITRTS